MVGEQVPRFMGVSNTSQTGHPVLVNQASGSNSGEKIFVSVKSGHLILATRHSIRAV